MYGVVGGPFVKYLLRPKADILIYSILPPSISVKLQAALKQRMTLLGPQKQAWSLVVVISDRVSWPIDVCLCSVGACAIDIFADAVVVDLVI